MLILILVNGNGIKNYLYLRENLNLFVNLKEYHLKIKVERIRRVLIRERMMC